MQTYNNNSQLRIYLSLTVLANLLFLFVNGFGSDLGYWKGWTEELGNNGYRLFDGNYPPMYIHWLYLVAKTLHYFQIPIEPNDLCKFLWEIPVILSHCILVWIAFNLLNQFKASHSQHSFLMLATALNPAILINGPIWGQIDLIPNVIALSAILIHFSTRYALLSIPLFTLSLLTKFQMICFAPIMAILFFHKPKPSLAGIFISIIVIVLAFLPFITVNYAKEAFNHAYIDTLGQYPVITMNAANIWVLLIGNNTPDDIKYLTNISSFLPEKLQYPKYLGMFLYAAVSLSIFIIGLNNLRRFNRTRDENTFLSEIIFCALVSAIAFFSLLPAMHERYLFPAIIAALIFSATVKKQRAYVVFLTLASSLNMLMILGINGSNLWVGVAILVTGVLCISLAELISGNNIFNVLSELVQKIFALRFSFLLFCIFAFSIMLNYLIERHTIHDVHLAENQILLTTQPLISTKQEYGTLQYNKSVDGASLSIGNRRFKNGLGTHANSTAIFKLPPNAVGFDVIPGIDNEVGSADVIFEIWEDENMLWRSPPYHGNEKINNIHLDLKKGSNIILKVDSHGENSWDHADWINPIITIDRK